MAKVQKTSVQVLIGDVIVRRLVPDHLDPMTWNQYLQVHAEQLFNMGSDPFDMNDEQYEQRTFVSENLPIAP